MSLRDLEMWESQYLTVDGRNPAQYHVVACFCSENGLPNNLELFVSNWLFTWDSKPHPRTNSPPRLLLSLSLFVFLLPHITRINYYCYLLGVCMTILVRFRSKPSLCHRLPPCFLSATRIRTCHFRRILQHVSGKHLWSKHRSTANLS